MPCEDRNCGRWLTCMSCGHSACRRDEDFSYWIRCCPGKYSDDGAVCSDCVSKCKKCGKEVCRNCGQAERCGECNGYDWSKS